MGEERADGRPLTFSEAQGIDRLPDAFGLGTLSERLRSKLYAAIYLFIQQGTYDYKWASSEIPNILRQEHFQNRNKPFDEFPDPLKTKEVYKKILFFADFNNIADVLQFICRHPRCPKDFLDIVSRCFTDEQAAYRLLLEPPTFFPITSNEEIEVLNAALKVTRAEGLQASNMHLIKAAELLSSGDYGGSSRESVHALESIVRVLTRSKDVLSDSLKKLRGPLGMHPAIVKAIEALYGYAGDEAGIRHSKVHVSDAVGLEDAKFVIGSAAAAISYMVAKAIDKGVMPQVND
jgi:hypothetical protein